MLFWRKLLHQTRALNFRSCFAKLLSNTIKNSNWTFNFRHLKYYTRRKTRYNIWVHVSIVCNSRFILKTFIYKFIKLFVSIYSSKFKNNDCHFQFCFARSHFEINIVKIHVVVANFIVLYQNVWNNVWVSNNRVAFKMTFELMIMKLRLIFVMLIVKIHR